MIDEPLSQALLLLAATVLVVTLARRLGLPALLGYLFVGMAIGPHALGFFSGTDTTRLAAELGIVFLLFTLGLEFSLPRMLAMRREVFGLGATQVVATAGGFALLAHLFGLPWFLAIVVGGAITMSSTPIVVHELTDRAELNRTHGRLAFSILLFQDLAFVPFLALASAVASGGEEFSILGSTAAVAGGILAVFVVLAAGRWLMRPLFQEIAHSRVREVFTLAVMFVALGAAWISQHAGLTLALGIGGVLTYVFFILASHSLSDELYGEIVVLWSIVFIVASTLYRPIEQLLARTLAERDHVAAPTGDALRTAGVIQLAVCVATIVVLLALRGPLEERLFSNEPGLYWAMLVALAGFALAYYARGYLAGKGRFSIYAALLMSEVLLRLAFAVVVALGILHGA
ncbi:MAG: cation:proton antiporter, partial [Gemmatimonadaceae bacterium]|nr:cation:proton antiporter [Gemmatimonadaceae bacterium]